jgi:hypothetical protein
MAINFDKFVQWAKNKFGEENVSVKNNEVKINSIFAAGDQGFHLWCSPSGGKKKRKFGVYRCFKTDKKGTLVKLVQIVDNCDRLDALEILDGRTNIRDLEKKLEEMLGQEEEILVSSKNDLQIPCGSLLISDLGKNNWWRKKAEEYLNARKIPISGLYICTEEKYKARIIIPYYDKVGKLIYWNARHIGKSKTKYLGPPKEIGVGKEDVVFMAGSWPHTGSTIYLCEGEFNAISLNLCEFNAAACGGKSMSQKQAIMLSDYKIVLCLDRDKAGMQGTTKMTSIISSVETAKDGEKLKLVTPPSGYNDWNEMLIKLGPVVLHHYIIKNQKSLDYSWPHGTNSAFFDNLWN